MKIWNDVCEGLGCIFQAIGKVTMVILLLIGSVLVLAISGIEGFKTIVVLSIAIVTARLIWKFVIHPEDKKGS